MKPKEERKIVSKAGSALYHLSEKIKKIQASSEPISIGG